MAFLPRPLLLQLQWPNPETGPPLRMSTLPPSSASLPPFPGEPQWPSLSQQPPPLPTWQPARFLQTNSSRHSFRGSVSTQHLLGRGRGPRLSQSSVSSLHSISAPSIVSAWVSASLLNDRGRRCNPHQLPAADHPQIRVRMTESRPGPVAPLVGASSHVPQGCGSIPV